MEEQNTASWQYKVKAFLGECLRVLKITKRPDAIEFKTIVNAKVDGELTILKRTDKVKVLRGEKPGEIEERKESSEEEQEISQEIQKEEINKTEKQEIKEAKKGFFNKIINWIKNIFKK